MTTPLVPDPESPDPVQRGDEPGEIGSDYYVIDRAYDDGVDPEPDGTPTARGAQRRIDT